jgi:DNA-binding NarL/FixJ family response regulator
METSYSKSTSITVLLADDHPITRAGIRATLSGAPDILIVGEAENGFDVQKMVAELRPRILLLDLQMPGPAPADLERWVRQNYPETETLVLTAHNREPYLATMIDAGVSGFLSKQEAGEKLITSIRRVASGESLFSNEQLVAANRWRRLAGSKWESLTAREKEILDLLSKGSTNARIGSELGISPKTVAYHMTKVLNKLGVKTRSDALEWAKQYAPLHLE